MRNTLAAGSVKTTPLAAPDPAAAGLKRSETEQHGGAAHRRRAIKPIDAIRLTFKTAQALE